MTALKASVCLVLAALLTRTTPATFEDLVPRREDGC